MTTDPGRPDPAAAAIELLTARGAEDIAHPGGTLLAHLRRVDALLAEWGARPEVRLAGLCHAFYGTDGFPTALGDPDRRDELASVIGAEAERIVYFYASCDRDFSYPHLAEEAGPFRDRFAGEVLHPVPGQRRDFAEITVANEVDVMTANSELRARYGTELLDLFASWRPLLGDPAWRAAQETLS